MARILLVDDEEPIRAFLKRGLEVDGHEVTVAVDGADGFADQRERATGLETVVIDVLTKPFSLAEMRSKVGQALALKA
jgi:two-component system cell cycle response regulator CpdR